MLLMRWGYLVLWPASLLMVLAMSCRSSDSSSTAKEAITAQDKVFEQAVNTMNVSRVMSVYWESPELVAFYPDGNYRGYDDVKQSWWDFFNKMEVKKFEFTESHIEVSGDMAYEWGMFNFTFQPKNGTVIGGPGRYLEVWKHIGKSWVIVADHASSPLQALMPETTAK